MVINFFRSKFDRYCIGDCIKVGDNYKIELFSGYVKKLASDKQIELIGKLNNIKIGKRLKLDKISCLQASMIIQMALEFPDKIFSVKTVLT